MKNTPIFDKKELNLLTLTADEEVMINGGDNFLHDVGFFLGRIIKSFRDTPPDSSAVRTWTALH